MKRKSSHNGWVWAAVFVVGGVVGMSPSAAQDQGAVEAAAEEARAAAAEAQAAVEAAVNDAAAAVEHAMQEPPDEAAVDLPAGAPLQIKASIQRVEQEHQIYFNDQGEKQNENHSLRLNLMLTMEDPRPIMGYEGLKVTRVVTSAAEELRSQDNAQNNLNMHQIINRQQQHVPQVSIYCRLPVPAFPADSLQEVSGSLTLKLGEGPLREAVLGPYAEVVGKRARIRGIEGSEVMVRPEDGRVRVEMSANVRALVSRIRLVNERGVDLPLNSWGSGSSHNTHYITLRATPGDQHQVIFELFDRIGDQPAVFTVSDVPLPVPKARNGVELVLDALPIGEGVRAEPLDRLPVIVEE